MASSVFDFPPSIQLKLENYFSPTGVLATRFGLRERKSQQIMIGTICTALSQNKGALVEAGTGTGKTFAYLLPAAEFITNLQMRGKNPRVIISTASRNLQDQLSHKDFPVIASLYPNIKPFTWKGASNYLCINRLARLARKPTVLAEEAGKLWALHAQLMEMENGTRDELPMAITDELWMEICGTTPSCCKPSEEHACFKRAAFKQAKGSNILCINHMFMAFMGLYAGILHPAMPDPEETLLILDEGHELLNQIRGAMNKDFSLQHLARLVSQLQGEEKWKLKQELDQINAALGFLVDEDEPVQVTAMQVDLVHQLAKLGQLMFRLGEEVKKDFEWQNSQEFFLDDKDKADAIAIFTSLFNHAKELVAHVHEFPIDRMLEVSKHRRTKQIRVSVYPFTYERELQQLFEFSAVPPIITSATLINGTKQQALNTFYLKPDQVILNQIEGEFDYYSSVKGFFFPQIQEVNDARTLTHWLKLILPYSHGNALVLFTNYQVMDEVFLNLEGWGKEKGYTMLTQSSETPVQTLVSRMKTEHNCVLFGNAALWTGIDVKGINLSSLIVTKLPFRAMDNFADAYSAYLEGLHLSPFHEWMLPEMINRLRQGIGRLKRDESDRGLLFILDPRFTTASYKDYLVGKLPHCQWKKINSDADLPEPLAIQSWLGVSAPTALPPAVTPADKDKDEDEPF